MNTFIENPCAIRAYQRLSARLHTLPGCPRTFSQDDPRVSRDRLSHVDCAKGHTLARAGEAPMPHTNLAAPEQLVTIIRRYYPELDIVVDIRLGSATDIVLALTVSELEDADMWVQRITECCNGLLIGS